MALSRWDEVEEKLILIEAWCRDGYTEEQIAEKLGIAYSTFRSYKKQHLALLAALKRGKEVADVEVENSLFKRANGYKYDEVTKELLIARDEHDEPIKDANGAVIRELKVTKVVTKEVQPDVTAQIFWLKNRKPDVWRDKKEVDANVKGEVKNSHEIEESLKKDPEARELLKQLFRHTGSMGSASED